MIYKCIFMESRKMVPTNPHRARTETQTDVENRRVDTGEGEGGAD